METTTDKLKDTVKEFILKQFLPGEDPNALTESAPLVTSGVLDSLATLKLVAFLEDHYNIQIHAHEVDVEHLNTVSSIVNLVSSKL